MFLFSSRYEPFGMTAIEAMACGTPTVVTIHGGLFRSLTFGRHALYADPFDREDLGMMIHKILKHPRLRSRLAHMGAHKARSLLPGRVSPNNWLRWSNDGRLKPSPCMTMNGMNPGMKPIKLFCSDLDGTLLGNPEAARRFKQTWESLSRRQRPRLCYNSGRLVDDILSLLNTEAVPRPDYVIGGVGTQLYDAKRKRPVAAFDEQFQTGWHLAKGDQILAAFPAITRPPPEFLHPYKSSWYLQHATKETGDALRKQLWDAGLQVSVIDSSARDLDVLPAHTSKGYAIQWLCERINLPLKQVLVAGDTGNDSSMFLLPEVKDLVVENAQPELHEAVVPLPTYSATRAFADGVLQGLAHFGVIRHAPALDRAVVPADELHPPLRRLFHQEALSSLTAAERELIGEGHRRALIALRKNIPAQGFSACSLTANEVTGTDNNYRAGWARDRGITVVGPMDLPDDDIRATQRATLRTPLNHLAPNGQLPAHIRLDDGEPDYSGVGGICALDGGFWVVLAFSLYVRKHEDWDLLAEYAAPLERMMNWLLGLDSNNAGLLEIPEAGDWTDLFGRSCHVLYAEVLWYRAAVAYGRMREFQKKFEDASVWWRRAQMIRSKVLAAYVGALHPSARFARRGRSRAVETRASKSPRQEPRVGVQRMDSQPHRPADGEGVSGVVCRLVHSRLPRIANEPRKPCS